MPNRVYLEEDCPVAELSVESQRERGASSSLPPLYFLHVWWARRPLTVSRASVLGSLLPDTFGREEFLQLMGIPPGVNPVAEKERIAEANKRGEKLETGFSYKRGFTNPIPPAAVARMRAEIEAMWGPDRPIVMDSFAGGGSIPFEAYRMGFDVILNELNPVASVIERATIDYPSKFGPSLADDIDTWGKNIAVQVEKELSPFFPKQPGEEIFAYIWVHTVACPQCELRIPLSPNWWLDKDGELGFQPISPVRGKENDCRFSIRTKSSAFDPDTGTISRGVASCIRCACVIESDALKREACEGRFGYQLAAIGFKVKAKKGRFFRAPTQTDTDAVARASIELERRLPEWEARGLVPNEALPENAESWTHGNTPAQYGARSFRDLFSHRQLLVHLTTLSVILRQPWHEIKDQKRREALRVYAALSVGHGLNYNSLQSRLHSSRVVIASTFDRHDFAFVWSFSEFDGTELYKWATYQEWDAFRKIAELAHPIGNPTAHYIVGDAATTGVPAKSVTVVSIDPPYYDNVMYAELADYFYVWMKRSLGDVFPDLFSSSLTDKDSEAIANVARFRAVGRGKAKQLANEDYTAKMRSAFAECSRVLRDDGVLTLMFTHKRVDAWDSLARALLDAEFKITATWPIHTESETSLHQAKKNAAASTILLVCRKRSPITGSAWWHDIQDDLRTHVRERAQVFREKGLRGQDISIACFGPALQVISERWPVKRKDGTVISPDEALDLARAEVNEWFFEQIAEGKAKAVDKWTRFYILAWYLFGAREFPYDEARKLALAVNTDVDKELIARRILEKKGNNVRLLNPKDRFKAKGIDPAKKDYDWDVDYVQAAILAYEQGQSSELARFHQRTGALQREAYRNAIQYLLEVLPRAKEVTEYHTLDQMWEANFQDSVKRKRPRTTDPTFEKQQRLAVFGESEEGADENEEGE